MYESLVIFLRSKKSQRFVKQNLTIITSSFLSIFSSKTKFTRKSFRIFILIFYPWIVTNHSYRFYGGESFLDICIANSTLYCILYGTKSFAKILYKRCLCGNQNCYNNRKYFSSCHYLPETFSRNRSFLWKKSVRVSSSLCFTFV